MSEVRCRDKCGAFERFNRTWNLDKRENDTPRRRTCANEGGNGGFTLIGGGREVQCGVDETDERHARGVCSLMLPKKDGRIPASEKKR